MLGKVGTAQKYHWAPPGFYLLSFFATFWPGAILAAIAVPFAWIHRREDPVAFCLAWIVPSLVDLRSRSDQAAALCDAALSGHRCDYGHRDPASFRRAASSRRKAGDNPDPFIPIGLTVGLSAVAWSFDKTLPYRAFPALILSSLAALYAWRLFVKKEILKSVWLGFISSACLAVGVFGFAFDLQSLKLSPRLAEVARNTTCSEPRVATLGYREPSLVFLTGTHLEMLETGTTKKHFCFPDESRIWEKGFR